MGPETGFKVRRQDRLDVEKCQKCNAICCKYMATEIDEPDSRVEFDKIRWYVSHENVSVFIEDGRWYLNVHMPCVHLREDGYCAIYDRRPKVCREYDPESCDFAMDNEEREEFRSLDEIEAWIRTNTRFRF